jgi:S1-C subfamily serine protease
MTISALAKYSSQNIGTTISWNTVQKYVQELVETNKVQAIPLPHSKEDNKEGLIVYTLKK